MDFEIEKIHSVLSDAKLPSNVNDLKNPSEEFLINLFTTFLKYCCIDVSVIERATFPQQDAMPYHEESDIISLVNLQTVLVPICVRIFIKDFSIADITSSGPKRIRRVGKFLANFLLYATTKESDIQEHMNITFDRRKMLQGFLNKKNDVLESMNAKLSHRPKQLAKIERYQMEIEKLRSALEENKRHQIEFDSNIKAVEEKKQKVIEHCLSLKAKAGKINKAIEELQKEVVTSPNEYKVQLNELQKQREMKATERETLQIAFRDRKNSIVQLEKIFAYIQQEYDKFRDVKDVYKLIKDADMQREKLKKKSDSVRRAIDELQSAYPMQVHSNEGIEIEEIELQAEERLAPLKNMCTQLTSDIYKVKSRQKEALMYQNNAGLENVKLQSKIKKVEEEITGFIKGCQSLYNTELTAQNDVWNTLEKIRNL